MTFLRDTLVWATAYMLSGVRFAILYFGLFAGHHPYNSNCQFPLILISYVRGEDITSPKVIILLIVLRRRFFVDIFVIC